MSILLDVLWLNVSPSLKIFDRSLLCYLSKKMVIGQWEYSQTQVSVPMLVCSSKDDIIISSDEFQDWQHWLKEGDQLWQCPGGHHFFHYFYPQLVGEQILDFYAVLSSETVEPAELESCRASH